MNRKILSLLLLPLVLSACGNFGEVNKSSANSKTQSKVNSVAVSEKISSYKQSSKDDTESEKADSSLYDEIADMDVNVSSISMSSIKSSASTVSSVASPKNNISNNTSNTSSTSSVQSSSSNSISSPQQAMELAESKYGNNNGDWEWTYLTDGTNNTSYFFVKAISKKQLANGSMTGTALSLTIYPNGTIIQN